MFESVKRICKICKGDFNEFRSIGSKSKLKYCLDCKPVKLNFCAVETVNLKDYKKNGGNVSKRRIDMVKSRRMHPEGKGEVILTKNGKFTDTRSKNY